MRPVNCFHASMNYLTHCSSSFIFWRNIMKTSKLILGMLGIVALVASHSAVFADSFPEKSAI